MGAILAGSMILIVSWTIENNNLVYFRGILVRPVLVIVFLVISTGGLVIMIVSWAVGGITKFIERY